MQQLSERSKVLFDTFSFKKKYERRRQHENEEDIYRRIGAGADVQLDHAGPRRRGGDPPAGGAESCTDPGAPCGGGAGLASGLAVSAGTFALIVSLKIVPRLIGKGKSAKHILILENTIIIGGILGCIATVFPDLMIPLGSPFLILYGLFAGIQVGCLVMALAEIMNVFPIMFRRFHLKTGLSWVITSMAVGKVIGGLWYFYRQIGQ